MKTTSFVKNSIVFYVNFSSLHCRHRFFYIFHNKTSPQFSTLNIAIDFSLVITQFLSFSHDFSQFFHEILSHKRCNQKDFRRNFFFFLPQNRVFFPWASIKRYAHFSWCFKAWNKRRTNARLKPKIDSLPFISFSDCVSCRSIRDNFVFCCFHWGRMPKAKRVFFQLSLELPIKPLAVNFAIILT